MSLKIENGCKTFHRNAPITIKFAPIEKWYQNFRLLTKKGIPIRVCFFIFSKFCVIVP